MVQIGLPTSVSMTILWFHIPAYFLHTWETKADFGAIAHSWIGYFSFFRSGHDAGIPSAVISAALTATRNELAMNQLDASSLTIDLLFLSEPYIRLLSAEDVAVRILLSLDPVSTVALQMIASKGPISLSRIFTWLDLRDLAEIFHREA
jgi:hypothetical protein